MRFGGSFTQQLLNPGVRVMLDPYHGRIVEEDGRQT